MHCLPIDCVQRKLRQKHRGVSVNVFMCLAFLVLPATSAMPAILYVDANASGLPADGTSWDRAYRSPTDALSAAQPGDEIWVAEGRYAPATLGGARTSSFHLKPGVSIYGSFVAGATERSQQYNTPREESPHPTIFTGDLNGDDTAGGGNRGENCYHVVQIEGTSGGQILLNGITITAGHANGQLGNDPVSICMGGGIYSTNDSSLLRLERCRVEANTAGLAGGGMFVDGGEVDIVESWIGNNASQTLATISSQWGGGAFCINKATLRIVDSTLRSNRSTIGGVLFLYESSADIANCDIEFNRAINGASVMAVTAGRLALSKCIVRFNTSELKTSLILLMHASTLSASNTLIADNFDPFGVMIAGTGESNAEILNCTIANNTAGPALFFTSLSSLRVRNSIIYNAPALGAAGIRCDDSDCTAAYSIVQGGYVGYGNLNADPRLRWFSSPPYQLACGSPAIDAADSSAPETDLIGTWRPMNNGPDMGALEFGTDTDGGGLSDDYEVEYGLNPEDPNDDDADSDGDGLDNCEEMRRDSDPLDPGSPRLDFYVDPAGDDYAGDGSAEHPWQTIGWTLRALGIGVNGTPISPITVHLAAGVFEEQIRLLPYTRIVGAGAGATIIQYYDASATDHVVVTGAEGAGLAACTVTLPNLTSATGDLLRIDNVAMEVKDVVLDGRDSPYTTGILVNRPGSSGSAIRNCTIKRLGYGTLASDSAVNITRNTFEDTFQGAVFIRPPAGKVGGGEVPVLGKADQAEGTGFNKFRTQTGFLVLNMASKSASAQYNDWGAYSQCFISDRLATDKGGIAFKPYIGKSLVDASLVVIVESKSTGTVVANKYAPQAAIGGVAPARDAASGVFVFSSLGAGPRTVDVSATGYMGESRTTNLVPGEIVAERVLLEYVGSEPEERGAIEEEECDSSGGCRKAVAGTMAPPSGPSGGGWVYLALAGLLVAAGWRAQGVRRAN